MQKLDKALEALERRLLDSPNPKVFIKKNLETGVLTKEMFLILLEHNHNLVSNDIIKEYIQEGFLNEDDFDSCGIDSEFVDLLSREKPVDPALGSDYQQIESIEPGSTEVYFWGMPGSGKSCALGAVLSIANNGGDKMIVKVATICHDSRMFSVVTETTHSSPLVQILRTHTRCVSR